MGMTSFREVLEKMLVIVVLPVRKSLRKEVELFSPHLVSNTCGLLASIVSELTASALGSEVASVQLTPAVPCTDSHVSREQNCHVNNVRRPFSMRRPATSVIC